MIFRVFLFTVLFFLIGGIFNKAFALFDPLGRDNNFYGIHTLFPSELQDASGLVNTSKGEWGYVTIPIQATDRDLEKWQAFMDECRKKKLIPIVRLATEPFYKDTSVWRIPERADLIDFANFLDSLEWPIENRYVVLFNEVNRFDEWGGVTPDPESYAELLKDSYQIFKRRSKDFFLIMAGLDNASPNDRVKFFDNLVFLKEMTRENSTVFDFIDGFASHSYPNPGFSQPPIENIEVGITTYLYELAIIDKYANKKIPVFITETGWVSDDLPGETIASYYKKAFEDIWSKDKDKIVAITPFLLNSTGGQFENFSFIIDGVKTKQFETTVNLAKISGKPIENTAKVDKYPTPGVRKSQHFFKNSKIDRGATLSLVQEYIKFFF